MDLFKGFGNAIPPEIPEETRLEVEGVIPSGLRGVLYRNGPGQYTIHGDRYCHLFDGDGLATRVAFRDDGAYFTSRFVQSVQKQKEDKLGKRIFGTYATRPVGNPIKKFLNRELKNVSNTNLVHQWGAVFALYEGGPPHRLDPLTLETLEEERFGGRLADQYKFSAHPHKDPVTGDLWSFGLTRKKETIVTVYNMKQSGQFDVPFQTTSPHSGILHDFAFTENFIIFVIPPVKLPRIPLGVILGQRSFYESLKWHPEEETCVVLIHRQTGKERRLFTEPFMNFHVANAWEEGNQIVVDLCNFENFDVMRNMERLIAGEKPTRAVSYLERLTIDGEQISRRRLSDTSMEFPRVVEEGWGKKSRFYYGTSWGDRDWISHPMRFDTETEKSELVQLDDRQFGGEAVPVPKTMNDMDRVWLLFTVLDTAKERSEVFIVDSENIGGPPVARLILPQNMPFQLHGNWVSGIMKGN